MYLITIKRWRRKESLNQYVNCLLLRKLPVKQHSSRNSPESFRILCRTVTPGLYLTYQALLLRKMHCQCSQWPVSPARPQEWVGAFHTREVTWLWCSPTWTRRQRTVDSRKAESRGFKWFHIVSGSNRLQRVGEHEIQLQGELGNLHRPVAGLPCADLFNRFTVRFPGPSSCLQPQPGQACSAYCLDIQETSPLMSVYSQADSPFPMHLLPSGTT